MLWINLAGVVLIGAIIWWFWIYKSPSVTMEQGEIEVRVEGGVYQPSKIQIPANQEVTIVFFRTDETPCSEALQIEGFDINESLPLNKKVSVVLPASSPGSYPFHCQMKMYVGEIIVE